VNGANITGVNFSDTAQTFSISGTISPLAGGSGATVTLSGAAGATTIADSTGAYTFGGLANGTYTLTPSHAGYTFSPVSQSATVNGASVTGVNFTDTAQTFSISGTISPTGGSGATVTLSGATGATTIADSTGAYTFGGLANGTYTLTPSHAGYTFSPVSQSATVNGASVTGVNFTDTAQTYSISGTISPTAGGSGATVTLSGAATATTTADGAGNYSFSGLANGNYALTPSHAGYKFSPTVQAVTIKGANVTGVNFTAAVAPVTYTVSGNISPASVGAGATVTLAGAGTGVTTADAMGNFSFTSLINGTYTITPSSTSATFSPGSQNVTVNSANVTGISFTATATANVIFFDDFKGTTLDTAWTALNINGNVGNGEQQCYIPSEVSVSGDNLVLTTQQQTVVCTRGGTYNYAAGAVFQTSFNFQYGTVEYRAKMAGGQGTWPAIWLLGSDCQGPLIANDCPTWPNLGSEEIDLTEVKGGNLTDPTFNALAASGGWQTCDPSGISDVSQNYHVYKFVWTQSAETLYIDGAQKCQFTSNIVRSNMFMIINIAMGGSGGSINNSTLPQSTYVDYVKITQP
jgi:beta-glucanase (GH16 family)